MWDERPSRELSNNTSLCVLGIGRMIGLVRWKLYNLLTIKIRGDLRQRLAGPRVHAAMNIFKRAGQVPWGLNSSRGGLP